MDYVFQFGVVWRDFPALLLGAWLTIRLSAMAMALGLAVGVVGALAAASRWRLLRALARVYVEAIRNTPFLVQVLFVYSACRRSVSGCALIRPPCWRW